MTILDACVEVLSTANGPLPADKIFEQIKNRDLYEFKARDPLGVVRGALRKHLRTSKTFRVIQVESGVYRKAWQ